jgi:hypothetical protein
MFPGNTLPFADVPRQLNLQIADIKKRPEGKSGRKVWNEGQSMKANRFQ